MIISSIILSQVYFKETVFLIYRKESCNYRKFREFRLNSLKKTAKAEFNDLLLNSFEDNPI